MAEVLSLIEDRLCAEKGEQERGLRLHSSSKKDEWEGFPIRFWKKLSVSLLSQTSWYLRCKNCPHFVRNTPKIGRMH